MSVDGPSGSSEIGGFDENPSRDSGPSSPSREGPFDFSTHARDAANQYQGLRNHYLDLAQVARDILTQCLAAASIRVHSIEARAKSVDSFTRKALTPLDTDPDRPKYPHPLIEITDLAGVRVITFFPRTVTEVDAVIVKEFEVLEKSDKTAALVQEGRFGYQSVHYLVRLSQKRCSLPEYSRFSDLIFESQVRTILQHAWAEIEHDIQYKSVETIPDSIRRRFMSLAGMLEIADREFQTIQDDDETLRRAARDSVREGRLRDVEITPDALKAYLDRRFGPDGRMSDSSYQFTAEFLRQMGFRNLQQVAEAITGYKDDATSRTIRKSRHGQLTRFEDTLLAGMGEAYILRHWWGVEPWFINSSLRFLKILHDAGVSIRAYRPSPDVSNGKQFVLRAAIDVARGQVVTDRLSLDRVFSILPDLEQKVLRLLYGFDSDRQQSVEEVAAAIGIPSWQVFQLRTDAFAKLETFDAPSR